MRSVKGRAWTFGDDVNTDVIHPPEFFSLDPEIVKHGLFNGFAPELQARIVPGDIFVCGRNFGCGSSRETSIQSLKLNRVGAIVAVDFARIFFRSATNNALPCLTFVDPDERAQIHAGQHLEIVFDEWALYTDTDIRIPLAPAGAFVRSVWEAGGLLEAAKLLEAADQAGTRRQLAGGAGGQP